jgi:hypothetical protein
MELPIPDEFQNMGFTIKVKMDPNILPDGGNNGIMCYERAEIKLQPGNGNFPQCSVERTFCHELVHTLFESIGREDLSTDESLVEAFAGVLHQALITMKKDGKPLTLQSL